MEGEPEAYRDDNLRSAGITAKERLARIEDLLVRMDEKLDDKASRSEMAALELRIRSIEVSGSKAANDALDEARRLAHEREGDLLMLDKEYKQLRSDHEMLGKRIAWALGALAVAAVAAEAVLSSILRG